MILVLDVGNTQIYGGIFDVQDKDMNIKANFRKSSRYEFSADEMGIFFRNVLREQGVDISAIKHIAISSVVPALNHTLKNACLNYFKINPFFLSAGVRTKLKIKYKNPLEVGADRIANAIAGAHLFPNHNLIIVDMGTATTFCVVSAEKDYLGGTIIPGLRISMEALVGNTAKLPSVEIMKVDNVVGRSTVESIQAGLFFGHKTMIEGITAQIKKESFPGVPDEKIKVIGTGGFWRLFKEGKIFDEVAPDLVLKGTLLALSYNQ